MRKSSVLTAAILATAGFVATSASADSVSLSLAGSFTNGSFNVQVNNGPLAGTEFLAWCLDEDAILTSPTTYEIKFKGDSTIFDDQQITADNQDNIQSLFDEYAAGVNTPGERRDFSDALWALADGKTDIRTGAETYLNGLGGDDTTVDTFTLVFFDAPTDGGGGQASQNLIAGFAGNNPFGNPAPVPLPAPALLLLAGLGGLGVMRRKKA